METLAFGAGLRQPPRMRDPASLNRTRRQLAAGIGAALATTMLSASALARAVVDAEAFGLVADPERDQTEAFRNAVADAAATGSVLLLPAGTFVVDEIELPSRLAIRGVAGASVLRGRGGRVLFASGATDITLDGIVVDGGGAAPALIDMVDCDGLTLTGLAVSNGTGNGIALAACAGRVEGCSIGAVGQAAVFAIDSRGLVVRSNSVADCGNGGILVWRSEPGADGTLVTANRIRDIRFDDGGNGQNGNGVNVFRAHGVIVADNVISGCAFSAVRVNSGNNTHITGNSCSDCGEVAIFSEFAFSGSVIADNIVDGAASGISITNFDQGGHLAVCTGNLVRNIRPRSQVNPDTSPNGISAEADTLISGNVVDAVPGRGIVVGWGPYLRNVLVSDNLVSNTEIGIAVSVAEGAGTARISGNLVVGATRAAIVGTAWTDMVTDDLAADASRFPQLQIEGNTVA